MKNTDKKPMDTTLVTLLVLIALFVVFAIGIFYSNKKGAESELKTNLTTCDIYTPAKTFKGVREINIEYRHTPYIEFDYNGYEVQSSSHTIICKPNRTTD